MTHDLTISIGLFYVKDGYLEAADVGHLISNQ